MKLKRVLNFWIYLMVCLPNSGENVMQNKQDDFFPLKLREGNEASRSKRMVSLATGLLIANVIMTATSLGVCIAHSVESAKEAGSGCYYIKDACKVEEQIKSANQDVLRILRELKDLDLERDHLKENYGASSQHFKSWTESLDFISEVMKEVEKIGDRQMNYWGYNLNAAEKLEKAKASYDEGLKDLLSSYRMHETLGTSALGGLSFLSGTMYMGFKKFSTMSSNRAMESIGLAKNKQWSRAQITSRVSNALGAISLALSAASTGLCAYGMIKSKQDAQKKYNVMIKYKNEIDDAVKELESAKNDYKELIKDYKAGLQQLTTKSNKVLDLWANNCPNFDEKTATEEDKKDCAEFFDQMKICVTCISTLREDLNLLNTNWKYVEIGATTLIDAIRRRKTDMKIVQKSVEKFEKMEMGAYDTYDFMITVHTKPELKSVILDAMLDNKAWAEEMGQWNQWQNKGKCFNECKQQHQHRTCKTENCIGHDTRTIPCIEGELENCKPKTKECPIGWTLKYGSCYKLVDIPDSQLADIFLSEVKTLTETQQTLNQRDKLDQICCKDAFNAKDCKKLNPNHPQLARIDFETEHKKIIVNNGHMPQHFNTQLVYLDLRVSIDIEDEVIQCMTVLGKTEDTKNHCRSTIMSSAVCEINLSNENNVLYKLMPKRCTTKEKRLELDNVCREEAALAESRRIYMLHDAVCTLNLWNQEEFEAESVSFSPAGVWVTNEDGTVQFNKYGSFSHQNLVVSDCVVQSEMSSVCKKSLRKITKLESGKKWILAEVDGKLYQRTQVSEKFPQGKYWMECSFCGLNFKDFSVSPRDHLWAIDSRYNVQYLSFGQMHNVDNKKMKMVSVGASGVWAVDMEGKIFCRVGTYGDLDKEGYKWEEVDGVIQKNAVVTSITSGEDIVFLTFTNGQLLYRASVSQRKQKGEAWVLANHESTEAGEILVKGFSIYQCKMIASDQVGRVFTTKKTCDCP